MIQTLNDNGYVGIFLALVLAGLGFPIPEELPVITAGILVGHHDSSLRWYVMLPVVIAGVVISDGLLYGIGRIWGTRFLDIAWVRRNLVTPEKRAKIEKNLREKGIMILLGARFVPGIRSPIFIVAGSMRVPLGRFLLADGLYAIPGVNVLFWLAYILTDQMMEIYNNMHAVVDRYRPLVIVSVLSAVAGALFQKYVLNRKVSTGDESGVPSVIAKPAQAVVHAVEKAVETVGHVGHLFHHDKPAEPAAAPAAAPAEPSANGTPTEPAPAEPGPGVGERGA
jgi:membrane protein DedA with SNARE-associated domain